MFELVIGFNAYFYKVKLLIKPKSTKSYVEFGAFLFQIDNF